MLGHAGMQADMVLEKELRVEKQYLDVHLAGSGQGYWAWLEHMRPQSLPP